LRLKDGKEGEGRRAGVAGVSDGACGAEKRKGRREEGEGGADKWGRRVSGTEERRKRGRGRGSLQEEERWAAGRLGQKGGEVIFSFFFFFPFSNSFQIQTFLTQNYSKLFNHFHKIL
jgi:hypothetical protein